MKYDTIIVGCGFAGAVLAERLANQNKSVLIIEQRPHIAGNVFDHYDEQGVFVHKYGPHLFHTDNQQVVAYLSQFTEWMDYQHRVLGFVDGQLVPVPFNLTSLEKLMPASLAQTLEEKLIARYGMGKKVPILELRESDDAELKMLADFVYDKLFVNYTAKQWGCKPEDISPEVTARVPVHISRDDRYFQDRYQMLPKQGYSALIQKMLDHKHIHLMLNTPFQEIATLDQTTGNIHLFNNNFEGELIFTGMIDELFDFKFGELSYRSLQFQHENLPQSQFQPTTTVNYPNDFDFTRITEFKHISGQKIDTTTIVREFPQDYLRDDPEKNIPYYPVFNDGNQAIYEQYKAHAKQFKNIHLVGRLAEFRYYDMDDIVARALDFFEAQFNA